MTQVFAVIGFLVACFVVGCLLAGLYVWVSVKVQEHRARIPNLQKEVKELRALLIGTRSEQDGAERTWDRHLGTTVLVSDDSTYNYAKEAHEDIKEIKKRLTALESYRPATIANPDDLK